MRLGPGPTLTLVPQRCDTQPTAYSAPRRGFSYVDLVEGLRDGRFYALKRILCHDKEDRQAALHEVEMHGLFDHPNILRLVAHCMVEKGDDVVHFFNGCEILSKAWLRKA